MLFAMALALLAGFALGGRADAAATTPATAPATAPTTTPTTAPATAPSAAPQTYLIDGKALMRTRQRAMAGSAMSSPSNGEADLAPMLQLLRRKADRQMKQPLWTVVNKPFAPPGGDMHDYVSLASYFWPDPSKPDGLPYISHDGEVNPETKDYDRARIEGMAEAVYTLSLAYYLTGQESYARRAAEQLRTWFLDEPTRMNPNLTHAQMVKGKNQGSSFGLIETAILTQVVDAEPLLATSPFWSADDHKALLKWFVDYLAWQRTSEMSKGEGRGRQNHGTYYDVQTADFALFTGDRQLAKEILEAVKAKRIATQIEPDGSQPLELARTKSLSYSQLNLTGMVHLAYLGQQVGVDLWSFKTDDGRSIRGALDWMLPYATGQKPWERQQITKMTYGPMVHILRQAAAAYNEPAYEQAIARLVSVQSDTILWTNLLYPGGK